jgi:molybdenum cofactor biosynthesis protein B
MDHDEGTESREGTDPHEGTTDGGAGSDVGDGHHSHDVTQVGFGVLTISSTRTLQDDPAGDAMVAAIESGGMTVERRSLVPDEVAPIRAAVEGMIDDDDVDLVVTSGGTGLTRDDVTLQAVDPLFTRQIPGFGELFRVRSYDEIGARAMASRAAAGLADDVPVFCVPGSEGGASMGVEELILPAAGHIVGLAREERE